jgi:primosomal protein N' (replication factor Y)
MTTYVEVAVNLPQISSLFDYHLTDDLREVVFPGSLVTVPFGKQTLQGVVWRFTEHPEVAETKAVLSVLDPKPVLTPAQLGLAEWLSENTLAPLAQCFALMLPPGLSKQADTLYQLNRPALEGQALTPLQQRIADLLERRGALRGRQMDNSLRNQAWRPAALQMQRRGWLTGQSVLPPPSVQPRLARTVALAVPPGEIEARLGVPPKAANRANAFRRRRAILDFLAGESEPVQLAWVYAAAQGGNFADLEALAELDLIALSESEVWRDPLEAIEAAAITSTPLPLTADQQRAWNALQPALNAAVTGRAPLPHVLYGVTGSGKTELYLYAVAEALRRGRSAVVLVPEISLTPQTARRFAARFPGQVGLIHSRLSEGERYDTWRRARMGQLPIIVGPRSALFAPLPNLGLIVLDEFHDQSYYQDEMPPAYSALETALSLARLTGSLLVLGSATPDVTLMARAYKHNWPVLRLPQRAPAHRQFAAPGEVEAPPPLPRIQIVDLRQELKAGNRSIFSRSLQAALQETLDQQHQAILFLNRRGTATYVFCRDCGEALKCPRCDLPLTFHAAQGGLVCHTCNYRRQMPQRCPACKSTQIRQMGLGTERVEAEAQAAFPQARVLRWDAETARQKDAHELLLTHFSNHQADILVGTQMIAKGLDLPLVTLVGVILAEVGLQMPDFRAGERAFQLLTQVAGRAGRSPLGGQAIIQTYQPDHYAIQAAARQDYDGFLSQELAYRRKLRFPPYTRLARLELRDSDPARAEKNAQVLGQRLQDWIAAARSSSVEMIGPAPCFFSRQNGLYRWQIILRSSDPAALLRGRDLSGWLVEIDPPSLL